MSEPIYLDHNATTPIDERVLEKMLPYFTEIYGNASSIDHQHGHQAKRAVESARKQISKLLGCRKESEVIFTSGATESNNLALIGAFRRYKEKGKHIISSPVEHPSVLETLEYLKTEGAEISYIPVDEYGSVKIDALEKAIKADTILISIMFANNEIGTIQPIKAIGDIAKNKKIIFHVDAAQAAGHLPIHVYDMNIDLMSFSSHKFYGPKGVGGLFVRSYAPFVKLSPVIHGGGQERGLRAGTINTPGIVGMGEALSISSKEMRKNSTKNRVAIRKILEDLQSIYPKIRLNGHPQDRLSHNLNITIPGVENKAFIQKIKDTVSISAGSACSTVKVTPSHVLKAMGLTDEETFQTIRIGIGKHTDIDNTIESLARTISCFV